MPTIDLNADLGEGCDSDAAIMPFLTSVNIACGGHAGDADSIRRALRLAGRHQVAVGAHPSYPDRAGFGRRSMAITPTALGDSLQQQIADFQQIASEAEIRVNHVKPHGALYNDAVANADVAEAIVQTVCRCLPNGFLFGPPVGDLQRIAKDQGLTYVREGFADRRYRSDGSLVSRDQALAMLETISAQVEQAVQIAVDRRVTTSAGETIPIQVDSLCIHGDQPLAVATARAIHERLVAAGIQIRCPK
ncbi:MAG: 5-oxoprolinase subunit PxpA [Planctomycetota bacterium]